MNNMKRHILIILGIGVWMCAQAQNASSERYSDLIARTVFSPSELSISTVTSIFGAPIVIFMMLRRQKGGMR